MGRILPSGTKGQSLPGLGLGRVKRLGSSGGAAWMGGWGGCSLMGHLGLVREKRARHKEP